MLSLVEHEKSCITSVQEYPLSRVVYFIFIVLVDYFTNVALL